LENKTIIAVARPAIVAIKKKRESKISIIFLSLIRVFLKILKIEYDGGVCRSIKHCTCRSLASTIFGCSYFLTAPGGKPVNIFLIASFINCSGLSGLLSISAFPIPCQTNLPVFVDTMSITNEPST